jgi:outer membrane protein OmpA-like peptidoglycan-associated protein
LPRIVSFAPKLVRDVGSKVDVHSVAVQRLLQRQIRGVVMRKSFIVRSIGGTVGLVVAVVAVSACGSNDGSGKKSDGKAPVGRTSAGLAQKAASAPAPTPVGLPDAGVVGTRPGDPGKPLKGVRHTFVLEGGSGFPFNSKTLSKEAKAKIDEMLEGSKVDLTIAHFEIEGHTDNLGSKEANARVGLARAEAVRLYLSERYEIPFDSITVVNYGREQPVADNATEEGRALNRRVVIKVLD